MNSTYLSQIDISNFRSFGPNFSIEIPPKPGLVVIYGMNGLGKTTFFEAIEWLLTDDVRRISDTLRAGQLDNYLTRHDADKKSHQVAIKFGTEEKRFVRTASAGPSTDELANFLTHPGWNSKLTDTTPYFRLTMFLPQSKRFRFEEEKPAEQWKLLEGPAGVERLRQMLQALGSGKTTNAFKRAIENLEHVVFKQQTQLSNWQELLRRRDEIKTQVSSVRVIEPAAAEEALSEVRQSLLQLADVAEQLDVSNFAGTDTARRIAATVQILDEVTEQRREQLQKLKDSSETVTEWDTIAAQKKTLDEKVKVELDNLNAGKPELIALFDKKEQLASSKTRTESEHSTIATQIAAVRNRASAQSAIKVAEETTRGLQKELTKTNEKIEKSKQELISLGGSITRRTTIASEIGSINEMLEDLHGLKAKSDEFQAATSQAEANDAQLELLRAEQLTVADQKSASERQIAELTLKEKGIVEDKKLAVASAEAVHKALATMCDHIERDATTCPICRAKYKSGRLHALAQESLAEVGVDTVRLDDSLSQVRNELSELQLSRSELAKRSGELPILVAQLEKSKDNRALLEKEIEKLAIPYAFPSEKVVSEVKVAIDAAEKRRSFLLSSLQALPTSEALTANKTWLEATVASDESSASVIATQIVEQEKSIDDNQAIVGKVERDLSSLKSSDQSWEILAEQLLEEQNVLASRLAALDIEITSVANALKAKELLQTSIQQAVDQARRELMVAGARQDVLRERWLRIVGKGSPDSQELGRLFASAEEEIDRIETNRRKCEQLAARLDAWKADTQSREIASSIADECEKRNNSTEEEVSNSLASSIAECEARVASAKEAFARAKELAEGLKAKADEFNDRALKPLTTRIQKFHDVLSPFRYQIEWAAKTAASGGTKLTQSVTRFAGGSRREVPPLAELSDGQISVQGLATLFAASTEYRWSRWPALLLDDPLQSSDLLHASAFIDIIRGLITELGYQIFLSSHDLEEAKYIIRKCERSGIAVTQCHLLGPGVNGVRWVTE